MSDNKWIYARFTDSWIFLEQGRLLYALLHIFARKGYRIDLYDWLGEQPLEKYGQMIHALDGLHLVRQAPEAPAKQWYLYDRPVSELSALPWKKRLQVRYDLFSPYWRANPIIMPYPMHPLQSGVSEAQLARLRQSERRMRVFFSGDTENYHRIWIRYPHTKLPRERIVKAAIEGLGEEALLVHNATSFTDWLAQGYIQRCVFTASNQARIESADWLPTLAKADFFLSPPGIVMPICHNIIEAMVIGTIPITNYPEWLDPPLRHGRECLAFDDEADLIAQLRRALTMTPGEIEALRRGVIEYYERHLRPDVFVRRVEASTETVQPILMYTERNVAINAKRLGRTSLLMQGTNRPKGLIRRWLSAWRKDVRSKVRG